MDPIFSYVTREPIIGFRISDNETKQLEPWKTPFPMTTCLEAKRFSVLVKWTDASMQTTVRISAGARLQVGLARPEFGYDGEQSQWLVLECIPYTSLSESIAIPPH